MDQWDRCRGARLGAGGEAGAWAVMASLGLEAGAVGLAAVAAFTRRRKLCCCTMLLHWHGC